jgi:hypothetical protein
LLMTSYKKPSSLSDVSYNILIYINKLAEIVRREATYG